MVILYKTLVRPVLEYGSVLWSPYQVGHQNMLNRIQTRFVRLLGSKLGFAYLETPVGVIEEQFGLQSLNNEELCSISSSCLS